MRYMSLKFFRIISHNPLQYKFIKKKSKFFPTETIDMPYINLLHRPVKAIYQSDTVN
jgi:hypothetical protein